MAQVKYGDTVRVHYTGKFDDGVVFDSSADSSPLEFTIGQGQVIPGFENAVVGMNLGESKIMTVPSEEAYGPYYDDMVVIVDREQFPSHLNVQVDQQLQVVQEDGKVFVVRVTDVAETSVTLDANHPLAGQDLTFDIQVVEIVAPEMLK